MTHRSQNAQGRSGAGAWSFISMAVLAGVSLLGAGIGAQSDGWQIGRDATDLVNPLAADARVMTRGGELYRSKCQRCHGAEGTGNGPDAERDDPPGDLTDARRVSRNPDGVLFYKIWNGRSSPKMPAFKTDISRDDVWAIVHFVKTLRQP